MIFQYDSQYAALIVISMKQQNSKKVVRPVKSLSARNFCRLNLKDREQAKKLNNLNTEPVEFVSNKKLPTSRLESKSYRHHTSRPGEGSFYLPEELQDQNMKLKGKVNRLTEELMRERVKRTQDTRHLLKMQKEVQVQFQDDKYLSVSRNQNKLIEGVKHQYQKMKQKYQETFDMFDKYAKRQQTCEREQHYVEFEVAKEENRKLKDNLAKLMATQERVAEEYRKLRMKGRKEKNQNDTDGWKEKDKQTFMDLLGYSSIIVELQSKVEMYEGRNARLQKKIAHLRELVAEKSHKIFFLDKLIIQKSNENHQLLMRERKTARDNKFLNSTLEGVKSRLQKEKQEHQQEINLLREKERVKFETERAIFVQSLHEKDIQIDKLSSQLKYVTTLISYIKMGDDQVVIENHFDPLSKKHSEKERSQDILFNLQKSLNSLEGFAARERVKTLFNSNQKQQLNTKIQSNTEVLRKTLLKSEGGDFSISESGSSENEEEDDKMIQARLIKRSNLKHSPDSIKMKHVKIGQLQSFRLELVYRFIYYGLSVDAAKDYLSFTPTTEEQANLSRRMIRWRNRFITMRETRDKLKLYPFQLNSEQSTLLARYMVEDATKQDVFCSEQNEIQRTIAKSILRAFVGQYKIPDQKVVRTQIKQVLGKSGKNLNSALSSLAPSGTISSFKLIEICTGINVDFSEEAQNFIVSQLAAKSPGGLNSLLYGLLFEADF